jgi:two-component system, sensor histidine kinase and response regulator
MIIGDHHVVKELLAHLFDNAVRYTQKGEVRLTARVVERFGDLIRLAISVEDTGPGIDAKILPSLSVPFKYGASNAGRGDMFSDETPNSSNTVSAPSILEHSSHGTSGSGLGIPIATNLARLFPDGDLVISSEPNSGTACTFTALFSYQKHSSVPVALKISAPTLCVCGPTFQAEALPNLLRREGFEAVYAVSSCEEALEHLQKADPPVELVILYDWTRLHRGAFSRLKGSDVAEKIRESVLKLQPKLCIVVSNGENRPQNDAFIPKPITIRGIRQVVSRMFGDTTVASEDTRGSRVSDRTKGSLAPFGDVRTSPDIKDEELEKVKLRILVAEDDRVNARVISASVRKLGHECHITGDGKTCALEFSKDSSTPYDIVFMDLYMPGMNGIDATKQIRNYEASMGLPPTIIIGVTAEDRHAEQSQMLTAGMDDIILKPVTVTGLRGFLRRAQAKKYRVSSGPNSTKAISDVSTDDSQSSAGPSGRSSVSSSSSDDSNGAVESPRLRTRKTILVAEDNDFTAKMTLQVLKSNGWECDRAKNGRDAFEMVTSNYEKYCIILMDIQMPLVDGLACTRQIREWERTHKISPQMKILALTGGDDDPQRRNECKSAGCDEFFTKPINYPKLVPQLQSLLNI